VQFVQPLKLLKNSEKFSEILSKHKTTCKKKKKIGIKKSYGNVAERLIKIP